MSLEEKIKHVKENYDDDKLVLEFDEDNVDIYYGKREFGKEILNIYFHELIAEFFPKAYGKWRKEEDLEDE